MKGDQLNIHHQLIRECQAGSRLAYEQLYKLYSGAMYNICRRMIRDDDEAQDLLQESFIDAFRKLPELREINTFSAWIKRIVVNHCINAIKKKRLITSELDEKFDVVEEEEDDFEYQKFAANRIMEAVAELPDGCRTVLNLYLFEGYDHKEIGQILGITESASKAQYSKAKSKVRNRLESSANSYVG
ncbi:MAG: RNA polymerase sigma factor [Bacteroidota bacterium]